MSEASEFYFDASRFPTGIDWEREPESRHERGFFGGSINIGKCNMLVHGRIWKDVDISFRGIND